MSDNKRYWCGIRGVYHIWHGEWSDPEVRYKNYICNEWDLQDLMYASMKADIEDGEDWGDPEDNKDFSNYCRMHPSIVKQSIIELSSGGVYESKKELSSKDKSLLESLTKKYGKKELFNEILNEDWVKKINTPKKKQFEANVEYLEDNYVGVGEEPCWDDLKYSRELYFETPSGGDFSITVEDLTRENVLDYLYDYDVDEAVELWWDAKNTPFSNIKNLYNDIEQWRKDFIAIAKGMPY